MVKKISRRQFLKGLGLGASAAVLANMGLPAALASDKRRFEATRTRRIASALAQSNDEAEVLVSDVLDFALTSDEWAGEFGYVKFQLHQALYNGEPIYYIRTDTSSPDYAEENGLVHVPLLNAALSAEGATSQLYTFENGADDQYPVVSSVPNNEDYSSAWHVHRVTFNGTPMMLNSVDDIQAAEEAGDISIEAMPLVVNFPVVKWADGELMEDTEKTDYLGTGPLIMPVDTDEMTVTFKLHACYPGSRYIITDTSAVPMAPMMAIAASGPTLALNEAGATDEIWVFGNGIEGPGVMGFQPAIFDNQAGDPGWSPFWDHYTAVWANPDNAILLSSAQEIRSFAEAGILEIYNGTPDTHPDGFVVNCPVPIKAPVTFRVE